MTMSRHSFALAAPSLVCVLSFACSASLTHLQTAEIARKACPSGHEFEEVSALEVPALKGSVAIKYNDGQVRPLPDAAIHLTRVRDSAVFSVRTGQDGLFSFDQLPKGSYRLVVCAEGFVTLESTVLVSDGAKPRTADLQTRMDW
jgi:hypothetical protein